MQFAIETTTNRREIQMAYNKKHNITPKSVKRLMDDTLKEEDYSDIYEEKKKDKIPQSEKKKILNEYKAKMIEAAKNLEFEIAAKYRDKIEQLKKV